MAVSLRHLVGGEPPVLLTGEPGIGKSRLVQQVARGAASYGWTILRGECQRRGGQGPYAPLLHALDGDIRRRARGDLRFAAPGDLDAATTLFEGRGLLRATCRPCRLHRPPTTDTDGYSSPIRRRSPRSAPR